MPRRLIYALVTTLAICTLIPTILITTGAVK